MSSADVAALHAIALDIAQPALPPLAASTTETTETTEVDISNRNDTILDADIGAQPNPNATQRNSLRISAEGELSSREAYERALVSAARNLPLSHEDEERPFHRRIFPGVGDRLSMMYVVSVVGATIGILVKHPTGCDKLRIWLWTNAALTLARSLGKMCRSATAPSRFSDWLAYCVKILTTAAMAWFVVGLVFVLALRNGKQRGSTCTTPPIHHLALSLVIIEMTMLLLSVLLALLIFLFTSHRSAASFSVPGISRDAIDKLRVFEFDAATFEASGDVTCAICLCDYEQGDLLRELPCASGNHYFHADCVDTWLREHASCPICREDPTYRQTLNAANEVLSAAEAATNTPDGNVTASVVIDVAAAFEQEAAQNAASQTAGVGDGGGRRTSVPSTG